MWLNPPCLSRYNVLLIVLTGLTLARFPLFSTLLNTANFLLTTFFCNNESSVTWVHEEGCLEMPARGGGSKFVVTVHLKSSLETHWAFFGLFSGVLGISRRENNTTLPVLLSSWAHSRSLKVVCCKVFLRRVRSYGLWVAVLMWLPMKLVWFNICFPQETCLISMISVVSSSVMS